MQTHNTRESDERLLMDFAAKHGQEQPELMAAVNRLKECHDVGMKDYAFLVNVTPRNNVVP